MADDFPWGNDEGQVQAEGDAGAPLEGGTVSGLGAGKGSETLEQVAIWGTVGLLGYFLVGPFIGLK